MRADVIEAVVIQLFDETPGLAATPFAFLLAPVTDCLLPTALSLTLLEELFATLTDPGFALDIRTAL